MKKNLKIEIHRDKYLIVFQFLLSGKTVERNIVSTKEFEDAYNYARSFIKAGIPT